MRIVGFLLLCTSVSACLFDASQPSGIVVRCDDDRDCRSPQVCGDGICVDPDVVAPGQIVDLAVELAATTDASLMLVFTAPGDDGNGAGDGPRRYRVTLTPQLAGGVAREVDVVATAGAREREKIVVDGLLRGTVYSIVVEATDDAGLSTTSAPLLAETGGALCTPDPVTGALTARGTELTITRPEHLVRLYGCEVIEGSLQIVDEDCEITQLAALRNLREVTIALEISGNELCGRGLVDLSDLAALESVEQLAVTNTGTLADLSLNAAVNSITISANRALTVVSLPTSAYAGGSGIDVQGNPALTTLVAGITENSVRIVGNEALQKIILDDFTSGDVDISSSPALTDVSLPAWTEGTFAFADNPRVVSLSLPSITTSDSVTIENIDELTELTAPSLVRLFQLSITNAPRLAALAPLPGVVQQVTFRTTALSSLPAMVTGQLVLESNPILQDVAALRLQSPGMIRAHDNPVLPPCALLALAATSNTDGTFLNIDLPDAPCPADTPLPRCSFFLMPFAANNDEQLARLMMCGEITVDVTIGSITSTAPLANLQQVGGVLSVAAASTLTTLSLPSLRFAGGLHIDSAAAALTTIDLPALASVGVGRGSPDGENSLIFDSLPSLQAVRCPALASVTGDLIVNNNPRLTTLDLGQLDDVNGSCEFTDNPSLCITDVNDLFASMTCASERQARNTGPCP
jgi:hypothetical protein